VDILPYRITYKDEEGDDVTITTDEELAEAFRQTSLTKLKVLRLNLSSTPKLLPSSQNSSLFNFGRTEDPVSIPVVYVSGRAFIPTSTPLKPDYGPKKIRPGIYTVPKRIWCYTHRPFVDPIPHSPLPPGCCH